MDPVPPPEAVAGDAVRSTVMKQPPPKRRRLHAVTSFAEQTQAHLHVRGLRGETGMDAKVFRLVISEVNLAGTIASGHISDAGERIPCTARFCEVRERRRSKKRKPIGTVQIGLHGDLPGALMPWIGEHLLESVSVSR